MGFCCDYENCTGKPYVECFDSEEHNWWYFCRWHYYWLRLKREFKGNKNIGFGRVSTDREAIEQIHEEIWMIQEDLCAIKEKLKIKEKKSYPEEKPEEKGFA